MTILYDGLVCVLHLCYVHETALLKIPCDGPIHNVASSAGHIYVRENMCTERYYDMRHSCCEQSYCMLWCCILMLSYD